MKGQMGMAVSPSCVPKSLLVTGQSFLWFLTDIASKHFSSFSWGPVNPCVHESSALTLLVPASAEVSLPEGC